MKRRFRHKDQQGVALVTVIFIGAALTAVASVGFFSTMREYEAARDDRRAAAAHGYAEAGIDRFIDYLKSGVVTYNDMYRAGCPSATGGTLPRLTLPVTNNAIGQGQFSATLEVFNPVATTQLGRFAPGSCSARPRDAHEPLYVAVTSTGQHPSARRQLLQILKVQSVGLPIGHFATNINGGGNPGMSGISLVSETAIRGRESLGFIGNDPYNRLADFYPNVPESFWASQGRSSSDQIPAAAHAAGGIFLKSNGTGAEFTIDRQKHCTANNTGGNAPGTAGQSLWDGDGSTGSGAITSGCPGTPQVGFPNSSKFDQTHLASVAPKRLDEQDHEFLRQAAQVHGLYCRITGTGNSQQRTCTRRGQSWPWSNQWQDSEITSPMVADGVRNFVAYFDFQDGGEFENNVTWKASMWACNDNPAVSRSATVIVRRGGVSMEGNLQLNGALIVDGAFKYSGGPTINGTIIAKEFNLSGGATFSLDECWVRNLPGAFLGFTPTRWSEIDR